MRTPVKRALQSGLVMPGLGQWLNGDRLKGAVFCALSVVVVFGLLYSIASPFKEYFTAMGRLMDGDMSVNPELIVKTVVSSMLRALTIWGVIGTLVWGGAGLDAYLVASKIEREDPPVAMPIDD